RVTCPRRPRPTTRTRRATTRRRANRSPNWRRPVANGRPAHTLFPCALTGCSGNPAPWFLEAPTRKDGRTVKKVLMLVLTCAFTLPLSGRDSAPPDKKDGPSNPATGTPAPSGTGDKKDGK